MRITRTLHESKERIHVIKDDKILLTVAPWYGAKLTHVKLFAGDSYHDVLWPISDKDLKENAWFKQSILFPYPNRLEDGKYTFDGMNYQWPINQPETNNQLHGMVYNHPFEVDSAEAINDEATISLIHKYDGSESYYPFPFELKVTYKYFGTGLTTSFEVTNKGQSRMPFGIGWHPYFQIGGKGVAGYTFVTDGLHSLPLNERSLPTGEIESVENPVFKLCEHVLDNAYKLPAQPNKYHLETRAGFRLDFDVSDDMKYLQLFTPDGGETIAVEPMTCNVNAFNNEEGLKILGAGEHYSCEASIKLSSE